jgi:hypothetical protein
MAKSGLTQRAVDSRESPRFSGIFLALADSRFQALSTPALLPLTQAVRRNGFFFFGILFMESVQRRVAVPMCARRVLPPAMSVMGKKVWWIDLERICVYPLAKWLWSFARLRVIMAVYGLG